MRSLRLALAAAVAAIGLLPALAVAAGPAAGPPFPDPVNNQAVYDTANVLSPATRATVEAAIDKVEADTGAEVVVYTQLVPDDITDAKAKADAIALMDQWGVGRAGVNDGLVILFDLKQSDPCHGQIQLYAGQGYREAWLSNEDRQRIFENDMLPKLRECDINGALLAAMDKVSGVPTWRVVNAVLGLVLAPLVLLLLVGGGLYRWYRTGKDPVYLDDPSILVPAPPPGLTPAAGAAVRDGGVNRRSLTAASLDLAVRGYAGFLAESGDSGTPDIGIFAGEATSGDPAEQARMLRARHRPMDPATGYLRERLATVAGGATYIEPARITELGEYVGEFNKRLETHVVSEGWYRERPSITSGRWGGRGLLVFLAGIVTLILGFNLPSSGFVLVGGALIASAIALFVISIAMPARTQSGAVIRAMLEAYRRTLEKTMAQARSMGQVVAESAIPLIESPDDAVAWGVALGLQEAVEQVLARSSEDVRAGGTGYYMPAWYVANAAGGGPGWGGGGGGWAPGVMSGSPIPDFGGMMTALGTIGNSPASSGGGAGGGGFSGGSSGGGGGGAGGGF